MIPKEKLLAIAYAVDACKPHCESQAEAEKLCANVLACCCSVMLGPLFHRARPVPLDEFSETVVAMTAAGFNSMVDVLNQRRKQAAERN